MGAEGVRGLRVALFGAVTPLAQEIRAQLEAAAFPVARLRLFDSAEHEGAVTEFSGEARLVTLPDRDLLRETDLSFICDGEDPRSAEYLDWAAAGSGMAVDAVGVSRARPDVPLVNCDVDPERIREGVRTVAVPHPIAQPLSTVLHRLRLRHGMKSACVTVLRPVSDMGKKGVDELHQQTVGLLNFSGISTEVFGRQVAFNLLPLDLLGEGGAAVERIAREDVLRVLKAPELPLSLRIVQAPIFYGHCYSVHVSLEGTADRAELERSLEDPEVIRLSGGEDGWTPVELASEPGIWIADVAADPARPGDWWIWMISDALRSGAARNAVRAAGMMAGVRT